MTNAIDNLPDYTDYGKSFNYAVWSPNTEIEFCNVPWNSDYRDIVQFDSDGSLDSYLSSVSGPIGIIHGLTYCAQNNPVRVDIPFNDCNMYNYLRVHNPAQPVGEKNPMTFYYFIKSVNYIAPNTTEIIVQLDVWQTYGRRIKFGNSYIERGHIGIADSGNYDDYGQSYLTMPEGFDLGSEYVTINATRKNFAGNASALEDPTQQKNIGVLVVSNVSLETDHGTIDSPTLSVAEGSNYEGLPNGSKQYIFKSVSDYMNMLLAYKLKPWVTQGIVSVTTIPIDMIPSNLTAVTLGNTNVVAYIPNTSSAKFDRFNLLPNFRKGILPTRYSNLNKFMTFPYSIVELTTYTGTPIVVKPECIKSNDLIIGYIAHISQPSPRIQFYPENYNVASNNQFTNVIPKYAGEFLDFSTGITNFPTFTIPNNGSISYLASNTHSIAFSRDSADWSQQRALYGATIASDQASNQIKTNDTLTSNQYAANSAHNFLNNFTESQRQIFNGAGAVITGIGQAGTGNIVGGVATGAVGAATAFGNYLNNTNYNNQSTAINNGLLGQQNNVNNANTAFVRDTNLQYAEYAAKGDYANEIAGINAKVQDAKMIQPTTSGQLGGDAFNLSSIGWGLFARVKTIQPSMMKNIGEFWLRYGYVINQFIPIPKSLNLMQKFTYWKMKETYITSGSCPEQFKQSIRGIFEKGVTVWNNPTYIGNTDLSDNIPIRGDYL